MATACLPTSTLIADRAVKVGAYGFMKYLGMRARFVITLGKLRYSRCRNNKLDSPFKMAIGFVAVATCKLPT
jgi:hypothetical protein